MSDFIPIGQVHYPKAKMSRPHVMLHDGTILKFCFPNAGIWSGYDEDFNLRKVKLEEIKSFKYNSWPEWREWQSKHKDKLYDSK